MKAKVKGQALVLALCLLTVSGGCGYTNKAILPNNISTIAIPPFKNVIKPGDVFTYEPGLEIDATEAVIDRILFDGNLKVADLAKADARLEGTVTNYYQEAERFNSQDSVSEYRLFLVCQLKLIDQRTEEVIWTEPSFSGDTDYFVEGASAIPERDAVESMIEDFARNVVDRIVEDW